MFANKLRAEANIYFIRSRDAEGREVHYFVRVDPAKEAAFARAMKGNQLVNYASFGTIIARGFGHKVSIQTLDMLKREHHYELTSA